MNVWHRSCQMTEPMDAIRRDAPLRTRDVVEMTVTADLADPAYQAYLLLRNAFTIALILAGADKFWNAMIDWVQYLAPAVPRTFGIPPEIFLRGVGIIELACVALYVIPRTSILGAILLTGYLGGAISTHLRIGSPFFSHTFFPVYVAALIWGGLYLRDNRVRALASFRR